MLCDYTAGWISGVAALLIGHPFDTIKIQQQVHGINFYKAVVKIQGHRGIRGYYRGFLAPLLATGTLNAIFFGAYADICEYLVKIRSKNKNENQSNAADFITQPNFESFYSNQSIITRGTDEDKRGIHKATFGEMFIAGSLAGLIQLSLSAPVELVKTKLQSQMERIVFKGPYDCTMTLLKDSGVRGLYRGFIPMAIRNLIGCGANFTVTCYVFKICDRESDLAHWKDTIYYSGLAGIASWCLMLPFDVIKTRMQADNHKYPYYRGMIHCGKEIYSNYGMVGLFRGFWSCTARAFPVNAVTFLVYEAIISQLCEKPSDSKK